MDIIDIVILVLLIPGLIIGLWKGFIEQAMGLIGLALGIFLSSRFTEFVSAYLIKIMPSLEGKGVKVVAFIVILIAVMLVMALIGKLIKKVLHISLLGWLDRLLGGLFGLMKYILVFALIISLFNSINGTMEFVNRSSLEASKMWVLLENISNIILPYLKGVIGF
ncbi:MAG: CvpA family protein [Bacteroidales bacterium]|nr:CvpA family protein [Bacteroidales bacterium]